MNANQTIKHAICSAALLCAMLCSKPLMAASFKIDVDTSTLNGSNGFLDLQLNPSDGTSSSATADVKHLLGSISLLGGPAVEGNVIGTLPGSVMLTNSTAFNDYFQLVQFGTSFSLSVEFAGDFRKLPSLSSTGFSLSLYGASGTNPLLTTDPTGSLVLFQLAATGITFQTFPATIGGGSAAQVSPVVVPLPATGWLVLSGLLPMFLLRRGRVLSPLFVPPTSIGAHPSQSHRQNGSQQPSTASCGLPS